MEKLKIIDRNPYTLQLNYKSRLSYKSKTGGCITLFFYLACMAVIGLNLYYFLQQNQFIYDQVHIKNDLGPVVLNREWFGFKLQGTNKTHNFIINTKNQQFYGLKVFVEQVTNINGSDTSQKIQAINGQNTTRYDFRDFYMFPYGFNMTLEGRSDVETNKPYSRLGIIVKNISNNSSQTLQLVNLTAKLIFLNNVTNPKLINPIYEYKIRICYIRDGLPLIHSQLQQQTLYFRKLFYNTDIQKFFQHKYVTSNTTYFDEELQRTVISNNQKQDNWLVQIKIIRSLYTVQFDRYYKKLTTYAAETFAVIGLLSIILYIYNGYNKWRFTQKQLIPKKHRKSTNIIRYYWTFIRNLKNISTQSSFAYSQFQQKLDIYKIIQKLNNFQARLRKLQGRSSLPPSDIDSNRHGKEELNSNKQHKQKDLYNNKQIQNMNEQINQIKEGLLNVLQDKNQQQFIKTKVRKAKGHG